MVIIFFFGDCGFGVYDENFIVSEIIKMIYY